MYTFRTYFSQTIQKTFLKRLLYDLQLKSNNSNNNLMITCSIYTLHSRL